MMRPPTLNARVVIAAVALVGLLNGLLLQRVLDSTSHERLGPIYENYLRGRTVVAKPHLVALNLLLVIAALWWVYRERHNTKRHELRMLILGIASGNIAGVLILWLVRPDRF
jgi:hypothetical protein